MLEKFLNLENVSVLDKKQQGTVYGGAEPSREGEVSFSVSASLDKKQQGTVYGGGEPSAMSPTCARIGLVSY